MTPAATRLLHWYDRHRRDLPWRRTRDPYRIWLSEVMLQQTRVETVLRYYERFLDRFPTVGALAAAPLDDVLALWSGLGYYRRARQLHSAAQRVAEQGRMPRSLEELRELPGIGPYTAAAVASIAFGEPAGVLDGNVERVVSRLLASGDDPKATAGRRWLLAHVEGELLEPARPGDSNQALMELGATVCLPQRPRCPRCPLRPDCRAATQGDPESYPVPRKRRAPIAVRRAVAVVRGGGDGRVLLYRRPDSAELLAGTWELPWIDAADPGGFAAGEIARGLVGRYGGGWRLGERLGVVRHGITHRSLVVEVWQARHHGPGLAEPSPEALVAGFFGAADRDRLPLSSLVTKALAQVEAGPQETGGKPSESP